MRKMLAVISQFTQKFVSFLIFFMASDPGERSPLLALNLG
jgi:hypothetical protein